MRDVCVDGSGGFREELSDVDELSDVELLLVALREAVAAREAGLVVGPVVDEVAWHRARHRAACADVARVLGAPGRGDAA
jgi:hypothetical protein